MQIVIASSPRPRITRGLGAAAAFQNVSTLRRRELHKDICDAARAHPTLRAAASAFGRAVIGPQWRIIRHPEFGNKATEKQRDDILDFFSPIPDRPLTSYKDIFSTSAKLWATAGAILLYGHSAWEILRNGFDKAIGFDNVFGYIEPNVDDTGAFQQPAYTQFVTRAGRILRTEFAKPDDLVFFAVPDFVSAKLWNMDMEALTDFSLPSDIYAMMAYLSLHKHLNTPLHGHWEVAPDVSDDDYDAFYDLLNNKYAGSEHYAENPLVLRGSATFKEAQRTTDDAPYIDGRQIAQREIDSVTGVPASRRGDAQGGTQMQAKESRREFWETCLKPWTNVFQEIIWAQVCVREFDAPGWIVVFDAPDFLTRVERASVHMRYIQWGALSPNEVREELGQKSRDGGDYYLIPQNMAMQGEQGGPPEPVSETDGDDPPSEEQPVPGQDDPERPDKMRELRAWRRFALNRLGRPSRPFEANAINAQVAAGIASALKICDDPSLINELFDSVEERYV